MAEAETWFSNNYHDMSVQQGVNAGFQFEFYCQRCQDAFRTPFKPFAGGQAAGWLGKAAGMFGGVLGNAENAVSGLVESGWAGKRDQEFREAVTLATNHFKRCAKCHSHVCAKCFDAQKGLCYNCAPNVQVEIEASRNQGELDAASQLAYSAGQSRAEKLDVSTDKQLVCPSCGTEARGAKFCPSCGTKLAVTSACSSCGTALEPGTKFCPECGTKAG